MATKRVAVWKPSSDIPGQRRVISAKDLGTVGVTYDGPDLVWEAGNRFRVDVTKLPSEVIEILEAEEDISFKNYDDVPEQNEDGTTKKEKGKGR